MKYARPEVLVEKIDEAEQPGDFLEIADWRCAQIVTSDHLVQYDSGNDINRNAADLSQTVDRPSPGAA